MAPRLAEMHEKQEIPAEVIARLKRRRLFAIGIPERYGGSGGGLVSSAIRAEALGYGSGAVALFVGVSSGLTAKTILALGTEGQKQRWVRQLAGGTIGTFQLTEPEAGSDANAIRTTATLSGRRTTRRITLSGNKIFVTNGALGKFGVVFARVRDPQKPERFLHTAFIVPDTAKHIGRAHEGKMGLWASHTSTFTYQDVPLSFEHLLGGKRGIGMGLRGALGALAGGRVDIAATALGMLTRALDVTVAHYKEELARGSLEREEKEAREIKIGEMKILAEAVRRKVYTVAAEYAPDKEFAAKASSVKVFATRALNEGIRLGMEAVGRKAYDETHPLSILNRDAKVFEIFEGTNEVNRAVVARHLLS